MKNIIKKIIIPVVMMLGMSAPSLSAMAPASAVCGQLLECLGKYPPEVAAVVWGVLEQQNEYSDMADLCAQATEFFCSLAVNSSPDTETGYNQHLLAAGGVMTAVALTKLTLWLAERRARAVAGNGDDGGNA